VVSCMYSSMGKVTSQAEATSNSEKIKPKALAIVELHESEGIGQAGRQTKQTNSITILVTV